MRVIAPVALAAITLFTNSIFNGAKLENQLLLKSSATTAEPAEYLSVSLDPDLLAPLQDVARVSKDRSKVIVDLGVQSDELASRLDEATDLLEVAVQDLESRDEKLQEKDTQIQQLAGALRFLRVVGDESKWVLGQNSPTKTTTLSEALDAVEAATGYSDVCDCSPKFAAIEARIAALEAKVEACCSSPVSTSASASAPVYSYTSSAPVYSGGSTGSSVAMYAASPTYTYASSTPVYSAVNSAPVYSTQVTQRPFRTTTTSAGQYCDPQTGQCYNVSSSQTKRRYLLRPWLNR